MTKKDLYSLNAGITACGNLSNPDTIDFVFRIGMISEEVTKLLKQIEKVRPKNSKEYDEYLEEQSTLLNKCALKDEKGEYVTNGNNIVLANPANYNAKMIDLKEKYKDTIDAQDKLNKTFNDDFLEQEASEFTFQPIPKKVIPVNITVNQFRQIACIVEKTVDSK